MVPCSSTLGVSFGFGISCGTSHSLSRPIGVGSTAGIRVSMSIRTIRRNSITRCCHY